MVIIWEKTIMKKPKDWRIDNRILITDLSHRTKISIATLSKVENELIPPSGKVVYAYWRLSKGEVTPDDFAWKIKRKAS